MSSNEVCRIMIKILDKVTGWKELSAKDWVTLLKSDSVFEAKCDLTKAWKLFSSSDWVCLLKDKPSYENACSYWHGWHGFNTSEWADLLRSQPRFSDRYEKSRHWHRNNLSEKIKQWLSFRDKINALPLSERKKLPVESVPNITLKESEDIIFLFSVRAKGADWVNILIAHQCIIHYCDKYEGWKLLEGADWATLLSKCPDFIDRCDKYEGWEKIDGVDWSALLSVQSDMADRCDKCNGWKRFSGCDWGKLLIVQPSFCESCYRNNGWKNLSGDDWNELIIAHPQFVDFCDKCDGWGSFDGYDWSRLLSMNPKLADRCDSVDGWKDFCEHVNQYDDAECLWCDILITHPEFSDRCDRHNGWGKFTKYDWRILLAKQPFFSKKCDTVNGWNLLSNRDWIFVLKDAPILASKCDEYNMWECFDAFDWTELLRMQPQFAERCDGFNGWKKFLTRENSTSEGKDSPCVCWAALLEKQPKFAEKCDALDGWSTLDGFDWYRLLSAQPMFVRKCDSLNGWKLMFDFCPKEYKYNEEEWDEVINYSEYEHMSYGDVPYDTFNREKYCSAGECSTGMDLFCWVKNSGENEVAQILCALDKHFWIYAFRQQFRKGGIDAFLEASTYNVANVWKTFTEDDWKIALGKGTDFVNEVAVIFDNDEDCPEAWLNPFWDALVTAWPKFLDNLTGYYEYSGGDEIYISAAWPYLIRHRPEWADHMSDNDWKRFNAKDWERLLHPQWKFLEKTSIPLDSNFWKNCLLCAPQFADACERHGGWNKFSDDELRQLVERNPNLMEHCHRYINWDDIDANCWISMFRTLAFKGERGKGLESKLIAFCDEHSGWRLFSAREHEGDSIGWAKLLAISPQFEKQCTAYNGWSIFNGLDWQVLLSKQPQFAAKCDACNGWDVMSEKNWMLLIGRQEQFAGKYKSRPAHKYSKWPESAIVDVARRFTERESCRDVNYDDWPNDYVDWREESGWNDMYGGGVDPSDIIEFRD